MLSPYTLNISNKSNYWEFAENFSGYSLNVGCGSDTVGDVRIDFTENASGANIIGNIEESLPFDDSTFDLVIAYGIIEHMGNPYKFAKEIKRVLKSSGTVSIVTDNAAYFPIYYPGQRHNGGYRGTISSDRHTMVFHYSHIVELLSFLKFRNIEIELCYYKEKYRDNGLITKLTQFMGYNMIRPLIGNAFAQYFMPIIWARAINSTSIEINGKN